MGIAGMVMNFGYDALWYPAGYAAGYLVPAAVRRRPAAPLRGLHHPRLRRGPLRQPHVPQVAVTFVLFIGFFYTMPQMKGAGLIVQSITAAPYWAGVVVVGGVITFNVALGGMKGITFVQAFQYWVKMFAIVACRVFVAAGALGLVQRALGVGDAYSAHAAGARSGDRSGGGAGRGLGLAVRPAADAQGFPLLFTYSADARARSSARPACRTSWFASTPTGTGSGPPDDAGRAGADRRVLPVPADARPARAGSMPRSCTRPAGPTRWCSSCRAWSEPRSARSCGP